MKTKNQYKKHFVFDLDDTLIDGRGFCGESMVRAIQKLEPDINDKLIITLHETYRGATIVDLYKTAIKELGLKSKLEDLLKLDAHIQTSEYKEIRIFDGVIDILEFLRGQDKTLHVCTNRLGETLLPILKENKIHNYFDNVISCVDEGHKKPDPKCLNDLITKIGDPKNDFIYFGDSEIDCKFARNSGIDFIIFDQYLNEKNLFKKLINLFLENKINNN